MTHLFTDLGRCVRCGVSSWASGAGLWSARRECAGRGSEEWTPDRPERTGECPTIDSAEILHEIARLFPTVEPTAKKLSREQRRNKRHRGQAP